MHEFRLVVNIIRTPRFGSENNFLSYRQLRYDIYIQESLNEIYFLVHLHYFDLNGMINQNKCTKVR